MPTRATIRDSLSRTSSQPLTGGRADHRPVPGAAVREAAARDAWSGCDAPVHRPRDHRGRHQLLPADLRDGLLAAVDGVWEEFDGGSTTGTGELRGGADLSPTSWPGSPATTRPRIRAGDRRRSIGRPPAAAALPRLHPPPRPVAPPARRPPSITLRARTGASRTRAGRAASGRSTRAAAPRRDCKSRRRPVRRPAAGRARALATSTTTRSIVIGRRITGRRCGAGEPRRPVNRTDRRRHRAGAVLREAARAARGPRGPIALCGPSTCSRRSPRRPGRRAVEGGRGPGGRAGGRPGRPDRRLARRRAGAHRAARLSAGEAARAREDAEARLLRRGVYAIGPGPRS